MELNENAIERVSIAAINILPDDVIGIFNNLGTSTRKCAVKRIVSAYLKALEEENGEV